MRAKVFQFRECYHQASPGFNRNAAAPIAIRMSSIGMPGIKSTGEMMYNSNKIKAKNFIRDTSIYLLVLVYVYIVLFIREMINSDVGPINGPIPANLAK